jgi:steroid delta-isomerase-like uncharacterized protein
VSEKNKTILHRYGEEIWSQGNLAVANEIIAPTILVHIPGHPDVVDREGFKQTVRVFRTAFPDGRYSVEDMIADEDTVVVRWAFHGTHTGELMGIAPTGKQVKWTLTCFYRVTDGKVQRCWGDADNLGLLQQLGAIPQ